MKSEIRNPKSEGNPKPEIRNLTAAERVGQASRLSPSSTPLLTNRCAFPLAGDHPPPPSSLDVRDRRDACPTRRSQRGISLIECLVYIGLLGVIISIGGFTLAKAWDQSRAIQRNSDDIVRAIHAGERWRADIRRASGPIRVIAEAEGEQVRIPTAAGETVYRFATNTLLFQPRSDAPEVTLLAKVKSSRMSLEPRAQVNAWRWELELQPVQKQARMRPLFTFAAVPPKKTNP
jgi:Tfp pilus assembly protein FimT